jgi:hypothetical protein
VTDSEILLLEVLIAQVIAVVLGTASIAAADWSYQTGHMRQALHSVWVSCSVTAICLPILVWTSNVFLGSGIVSQGLVGTFTGLIFYGVHRNLPKFPSLRKSPYASPSPTVSSEPFGEERRADAGS